MQTRPATLIELTLMFCPELEFLSCVKSELLDVPENPLKFGWSVRIEFIEELENAHSITPTS
jgi:hypothetical protein